MELDSSLQVGVADALLGLLTERPQLESFVWTVGEQPGVLYGRMMCEGGYGNAIDVLAELAGGTVVHSMLARGADSHGLSQLVTNYRGVPVHVWSSYPVADSTGLTSGELADLLAHRPLGQLLCLPVGGAR